MRLTAIREQETNSGPDMQLKVQRATSYGSMQKLRLEEVAYGRL
jgi:hypothetical protein